MVYIHDNGIHFEGYIAKSLELLNISKFAKKMRLSHSEKPHSLYCTYYFEPIKLDVHYPSTLLA